MDWVEPVCQYVMQRLPKDERGFNDHAMTAWQFGCMLLDACGYAEERPWGAALVTPPKVPDRLPILADVSTVVLTIAGQVNELSWRQADGMPMPRRQIRAAGTTWTVVHSTSRNVPLPTVDAGRGFGPAWFSDEVQDLLELLGLVQAGAWTAQAHPVLLREQPAAWEMHVPETDVFRSALGACVATMPEDVKEAIVAVSHPAPQDWVKDRIEIHLARHETRAVEARTHGVDLQAPDIDHMRRKLRTGWPSLQTNEVESLFYARWRCSLGWDPKTSKLLPLFHDRLAKQMVKAVIEEIT